MVGFFEGEPADRDVREERKLPRVRAVLWDNDGVLVDTERVFFQVNRELFAAQGFELSHTAFFDWFLMDNRGGWHLLRERGDPDERIGELRRERNRRFGEIIGARQDLLIAGMDDVLRHLAPQVTLALVTSASREHLQLAHRHTGLLPYFDVVVTEDDCPNTKPCPDPYLMALRQIEVPPEECIAVEDSPRGVLAAQAAGIRCIVLRSELTAHYPFREAHAVVNGTTELLDVLRCLL